MHLSIIYPIYLISIILKYHVHISIYFPHIDMPIMKLNPNYYRNFNYLH